MGSVAAPLTLGVEEEYLLVDAATRDLANRPPPEFMERCKAALKDRVTHEFLHSQVEIGTDVCSSVGEAGAQLADLRGTVARIAARFDMRYPIAKAARADAERFGVDLLPTIFVVAPDGRIGASFVGAVSEQELVAAVDAARGST